MRTLWSRVLQLAAIVGMGAGLALQAAAQVQAPRPLTALDYAQIQQLVNRLNFALDYCGNGGREFAELFTADGQYIIDEGGKLRILQGADKLLALAGGPDCKAALAPPRSYLAHVAANLVIEASAEGARGKAYAIYPSRNGKYMKEEIAGQVGLYLDVYVRTANGWRLKSRRHVTSPPAAGTASGQ
ncbi:MAG: nuclear transport factor 2 family protein [Steroidobacteraceae bacterium]